MHTYKVTVRYGSGDYGIVHHRPGFSLHCHHDSISVERRVRKVRDRIFRSDWTYSITVFGAAFSVKLHINSEHLSIIRRLHVVQNTKLAKLCLPHGACVAQR